MSLLALVYVFAYIYSMYVQKSGMLYDFFKDSKVCLGLFILSTAVIIF
jgi:hypothetical protein